MKKPIQFIVTFVYFIAAFILLSPVWDWLKGDGFHLTKENIIDGIFLGIAVPLVMFISRNIKSTWIYIPVAICVIAILAAIRVLAFPQ